MGTTTLAKPAEGNSRAEGAPATSAVQAASGKLDKAVLRSIILSRICAVNGATRSDLNRDIQPLATHKLSSNDWRTTVEMDLGLLKADGLVTEKSARLRATPEGVTATASFLAGKARAGLAGKARAGLAGKVKTGLAGKGKPPTDWSTIKHKSLMALALGMEGDSANRIASLTKPDGLRALVVQKLFALKIKGVATPARVRSALAVVALERAFGNQITSGLTGTKDLSAKASRLLAGQLSAHPRDFGTDRRLIAALAGEFTGASQNDVAALQMVVLRSLLAGVPFAVAEVATRTVASINGTKPASKPGSKPGSKSASKSGARQAKRPRKPASGAVAKSAPKARKQQNGKAPDAGKASTALLDSKQIIAATDATSATAAAPQAQIKIKKPDLNGFSQEVHIHAKDHAQGWSGDRKAFISQVWQSIRHARPEWGLSDIEFKCMLAEAHQAGHVLLTYADLKDKKNIKQVQASAIAYKNTVWHYIRVEA